MKSNLHIAKSWPDDLIDRVAKMLTDKMSAGQIAAELGMTRNAVIGRVRRIEKLREIGLKGTRPQISTQAKPRAVSKRVRLSPRTGMLAAKPVNVVALAAKREAMKAPAPKLPAEPELPMKPRMLKLVELEARDCKFPIGVPGDDNFGFCGQQREGTLPYCPYHARIAYTAVGLRAKGLAA